ncbi:MAG TPA: type II toxin-antitoxin system RelE/ParE family toxin [Gemmataceae bacterium]|jgi:plasmid stabilization system protein ParE
MSFTVEWMPLAERRLTELWNAGPDRQSIADAADQADILLQQDPLGHGESRAGDTRLMFVRPLSLLFRVDVQARVVQVIRVKREKPAAGGAP